MGLRKFWPNLNILQAFVKGVKVWFSSNFASQRLNFSYNNYQSRIAVSRNLEFTIPYLHFCTSMWPCNILCVSHWTLNFLLCFSTELDVEDFDAFLEKVKARSLGNSPFACKFRLASKNF